MVNLEDLVKIRVNQEMLCAAKYFAQKRILYEYPRKGYGEYNESHLINIRNGYLGEFAFFEYVHDYLVNKYKDLEPLSRYKKIKDFLVYKMIIGKVQPDWDFLIKDISIEVKTYGTRILENLEEVFNYNLFIDIEQAEKSFIPDIYVQCFLLKEKENLSCVLAGFHKGLPDNICKDIPKPAYCISVKDLTQMSDLFVLLAL